MEKIIFMLAQELKIKAEQAESTLKLLDEGNTVPFIARYRKEVTGSLDEEQIRSIEARAQYLRALETRKTEILAAIEEQGKLTPELKQQILAAEKIQVLEDLYLPYRPKKRTRAQIAREKGLEPLANYIVLQIIGSKSLSELARPFIATGESIQTEEEAWNGAKDIVAENISDRADVRAFVRRILWQKGTLASELATDETTGKDFLMYKDYSEPLKQLPPHRILALNRGEKLKYLKLHLSYPEEELLAGMRNLLRIGSSPLSLLYDAACTDAFKRLIFPSIERELRGELTEKAEAQAIHVFAVNLRQLLLQRPIGGHTVLGLDPGYRTGCKAAVIDPQGKVLATDALFITGSQPQQEIAEQHFLNLVKTFAVTLVSIGNGTASYETEEFTAKMIEKHRLPIAYIITSEAGASVYSASPLAREELPDLDVSLRGAVSIARRIQDPLAELVKIEPKAIGVGQYQHDVNQKELNSALKTVIESCVNHVGVDLNTASPALLSFISGISSTVAKNIIAYRNEHGRFRNRKELLKVPRLGPAAFTQCAGFLRITQGDNPLDNTPVHPESYSLTEKILSLLGCKKESADSLAVQAAAAKAQPRSIAEQLQSGIPTVTDILQALARPGRDPREDSPAPMSRKNITKLSDLPVGTIVKGMVRNVVDFGCFVDIGVKVDGLIHRSELSDKHFKHPLDIIAPGDIVEAMIISIDEARNRIGLSLKKAVPGKR